MRKPRCVIGNSTITPQSSLNIYSPPATKKSERDFLVVVVGAGRGMAAAPVRRLIEEVVFEEDLAAGPEGRSDAVPTSKIAQPQAHAKGGGRKGQ
ncbi:MAG: hypothetical protein WDM89_00130 [Rhizomicrobium sp.]